MNQTLRILTVGVLHSRSKSPGADGGSLVTSTHCPVARNSRDGAAIQQGKSPALKEPMNFVLLLLPPCHKYLLSTYWTLGAVPGAGEQQ